MQSTIFMIFDVPHSRMYSICVCIPSFIELKQTNSEILERTDGQMEWQTEGQSHFNIPLPTLLAGDNNNPGLISLTYKALVQPVLKHASQAWNQHCKTDINSLEMVQRRAARWVKAKHFEITKVKATSVLNIYVMILMQSTGVSYDMIWSHTYTSPYHLKSLKRFT